MAIYHLSAKPISRATGRTATGAAAYRAGETITDERTGLVFDYGKKRGINYTEIIAPVNAPEWAHDRDKLWNAVEHSEKRKDSQVAREVEVALPTELTPDQQRELVRSFARSQFVDAGMVADIAIHHAKSENPHAHILLTMRDIGQEGFGQKNRSWNDKEILEAWRKAWEVHANRALERAGQSARIDHRTLADQGIERLPQIHIGPNVPEMERRGIRTEIGGEALAIETKNEAIAALQSELEATRNERNHEAAAGPERGADRRPAGAIGAELGGTVRPGTSQHQEPGGRQPTASARVEQPASERSAGGADSGPTRRQSRPGATAGHSLPDANGQGGSAGAERPILDTGDRSGHVVHPRSNAIDRVMALAGPSAGGSEHVGRQGSGRDPQASNPGSAEAQVKPDRSYLAARRQLDAMGVDSFQVGIRDQAGRMLMRTWSKSEVLASLAWLKRENAKGADVYVRPAGESNAGLVLVDDLNRGRLAKMQVDGLTPACVTETSPGNFQAWVRVHDKPLPPEVATEVAKALAERYGGDPNSADWRHFGRLAGLTNAKPRHKDANGRSPYVLAHESSGKQAEAGQHLVQQAAQRIRDREAKAERQTRLEAAKTAPERTNGRDPTQTYRYGLKALYARFGASMDVSKADYMIGVDMVRKGFKPEQIGQAIEEASPELPTRKAGHEADYVARTVKAVMNHPEVVKHQQEQAREAQQRSSRRERDSGPSFGM